jgi:Uma2 family endonuclease
MSTKALMTVEQYAQMIPAETENYELVDGELVLMPGAPFRHNLIRDQLGHLLWTYFKGGTPGIAVSETPCRISDDTVRIPDLLVFPGADRPRKSEREEYPLSFPPDIAVEILSPSESAMDARRKVRDYLGAGSKEVWLVDHANEEVVVHTKPGMRLFSGSDVLESPLLPGFGVAVADLFAAA